MVYEEMGNYFSIFVLIDLWFLLLQTVVAKVIHDGALRGPELSDDELKQKIQATEGAGDFTEAEVVRYIETILDVHML